MRGAVNDCFMKGSTSEYSDSHLHCFFPLCREQRPLVSLSVPNHAVKTATGHHNKACKTPFPLYHGV